jgi:hypothetical protein
MKLEIKQLRTIIKELNLNWLDEEIEEILTTGKLQQKEIFARQIKKNQGIEQLSFSENEQLETILNALRNYFLNLPLVQKDLEKTIKEKLNIYIVHFYEDHQSKFDNVSNDTTKLEKLLNEMRK